MSDGGMPAAAVRFLTGVAFGFGARECSGGIAAGAFAGSHAAGDFECRVAFGIGTLLLDGMLVWTLGAGLRAMGMPGRLPDWTERLGRGLLAVALAPIVLLLVAATAGKRLVDACIAFARTGAWPRRGPPAKGPAER